ncbi:MAG: hypothetical protein ABF449_02765 [Ethanoligenens sp.]
MGMRVPYIASIWDTTPCVVSITQGLTEGGAPNVAATYTGKCNFSEKNKILRQPDGTMIQLTASLTICGDIAPNIPVLNGYVEIAGVKRDIVSSGRPRNPDGSVHHTELGLC